MTLGEKIKKLRLAKGLTQADLANQIHVTFQTVSKWENDENEPDVATLRELAKVFECSMDHLLSPEEETQSDSTTAVVAPVQPATQDAVEEKTIVIHEREAHVCEVCGKDIPEEELKTASICVRHGRRGRPPQYRQGFYHKTCYAEKLARDEAHKEALKKANCAKAKKIAFGWSIAIGVVSLAIAIAVLIAGGEMGVFPSILLGIAIGYALFSEAYCIFTGSYLSDVFIWCSSLSIKFPGLIFSWDIDGFVWVICMKILFVVLSFIIGLLALALGIIVCGVLGAISFPFVLIHNNNTYYEDSLFGF